MIESFIQDIKLHSLNELGGAELDWTSRYRDLFDVVSFPTGRILDVGSNESRLKRWSSWNGFDIDDITSLDIRCLRRVDVRATARKLPFKDNSFDSVVALYSVPILAPSKQIELDAVVEMARVSKESVLIWPVPWHWYMRDADEAFTLALSGDKYGTLVDTARSFILNNIRVSSVDIFENDKLGFPFDAMVARLNKRS